MRVALNEDQAITLYAGEKYEAWPNEDGTWTVSYHGTLVVSESEITVPTFELGGVVLELGAFYDVTKRGRTYRKRRFVGSLWGNALSFESEHGATFAVYSDDQVTVTPTVR